MLQYDFLMLVIKQSIGPKVISTARKNVVNSV